MRLHVGGHQIAEPRIQLKGYDESWICAGFPLEAIEHTALFGWREVAGVAVE